MKLFKSFLLPLLALTLVFTACEREAEIDEIEVPDITVPAPETVESVNVYARNNGQNDEGLDFDCFVVLYPFALVNDEGAEYAINEEADLVALQDTEIIDFVYPLDVDQDGELSSIASGEELAMLFAGCIPDGGWDDGFFPAYLISFDNSCYEFVYPISLENWEGETVTANNESEFNTAITNEPHNFIFPFSIVDEDGEVISVADIDELFDALFDCNGFSVGDSTVWDYEVGFEYIGCYMVEFPIDIVLDDGTVVTVNNHEEMCEYMFEGSIADYTYPLTLISEEGEEVVVGSAEELEELLAECWEDKKPATKSITQYKESILMEM